jgi:hypothetical protein
MAACTFRPVASSTSAARRMAAAAPIAAASSSPRPALSRPARSAAAALRRSSAPAARRASAPRAVAVQAAKGYKVAVLGAAGGIGQPLSLLLKMQPYVSQVRVRRIGKKEERSRRSTRVRAPGNGAGIRAVRRRGVAASYPHHCSCDEPALLLS